MRAVAGSILIGFTLLAQIFKGLNGGTSRSTEGYWDIGITISIGIEILLWLFMILGVGLLVWEIADFLKSHKKVN